MSRKSPSTSNTQVKGRCDGGALCCWDVSLEMVCPVQEEVDFLISGAQLYQLNVL